MTKEQQKIQDTLSMAMDLMKKAGADYAEASFSSMEERGVTVRMGVVENLERSKSMEIDLTMRIGHKSESTSISSRSVQDLSDTVKKLAAALRLKQDYEYDRPADPEQISRLKHNRSLDVDDRTVFTTADMIAKSKAMEEAALAMSKIVNSEGSSASWTRGVKISANSRGEIFSDERTHFLLGVTVIASQGQDQQTEGEVCGGSHYEDLWTPEDIGQKAGLQAGRSLRARKVRQGDFPVVFHPDLGASLLGHFAKAITGSHIRKKTSFLTSAMDSAVFAPGMYIADNPHLKRGLDSSMYSSDGLPTRPMTLVDNGVLKAWLIGLENARRLGLESTVQMRGKTNLTIEPGAQSPDDLIADIKNGLYVTGLMGEGVNLSSGAYSRAAKGFWIKNGRIDYDHPVDKLSISSNLADMFRHLSAANDLDRLRSNIAVPTLRVERMSIA